MSAIDNLLGAVGLLRRSSLQAPEQWMWEAFGGAHNGSGVRVTPQNAMRLSAVWACVNIIAGAVSSLPLQVYERYPNGRRRVFDHEIARLIANPSPAMTSVVMRETQTAHVLLWGNCYAAIVRNGGGEPVELIPIMPSCVRVLRTTNRQLAYEVMLPGEEATRVAQADMVHVPGLGFDGLQGLSVIGFAAQSMGLSLAAEGYGATFFGNSSIPAGFITMPKAMSAEQANLLRDQWNGIHGGSARANKTAVIPGGGEFKRITMPNNEAQFLETRKLQTTEMARWFQVPPHMIADLERGTFSNIEHQGIDFVQHTLRRWLVRWEQELNRKLFPPRAVGLSGNRIESEESPYYCEFNVDGLMRGDSKAQADYFARALGGPGAQGWMTINEVRELKNLPPIPGGDKIFDPKSAQKPTNQGGEDLEGEEA